MMRRIGENLEKAILITERLRKKSMGKAKAEGIVRRFRRDMEIVVASVVVEWFVVRGGGRNGGR